MAVTKEQVNIYMDKRSKGATQAVAAAKAGISERTARRVDKGDSGAGPKKRRGRTRPDPFAEVWPELRSKLGNEPDLQPITLLEWLQERYPGSTPSLRTHLKSFIMGSRRCPMAQKRRQFGREFKEEAVELASRPDVTIKDVANDLGIHRSVLERWCRASNTAGEDSFPGKGQPRDEEVARLRRELARVKKERDFLRDAAAFFARESPGGTR